MRRIGILGGTFNPIHLGHLILAEWAMEEERLDEVWMIPTGVSYMKDQREIASGEDRLAMTRLAVEGNCHLKCLDIEVHGTGNSYSYETLKLLRTRYPEDLFFFIIGADCLFTIEKWKYPERIFQSCTIIAAVRDESGLSVMEEKRLELEKKFHGKIRLLSLIRMAVSSTEIRQRIRSGQSVRYLVPDKVISYIEEKELYCEEGHVIKKDQKSDGKLPGPKAF